MMPQRHHLVYLDPDADFSIISCHGDKQAIKERVQAWLATGLPCIYAKQIPHEEKVTLGLPLLYANKKHRVGLQIVPSAVKKLKPLPLFMEMQDFFRRYYGMKDLHGMIEPCRVSDIAVYGSFLFHYLSGQAFVNEHSDLDLLINYHGYSLADLNELIVAFTKKLNRTIDGEVRFYGLGDIPIKELLNLSAKKLLCKTKDNVVLISRTELYEYYPVL